MSSEPRHGLQATVADIDQSPGEPTGKYYTGRTVKHASEFDGKPVGIPVLEDVGHPKVPDLDHGYYPRELFGNRTDLEIVVRTIADPDYCTLLIGETGVGKNVLLKKIFQETNWPMQRVNFGSGTTHERLVGMHAPEDQTPEDLLDEAERLSDHSNGLVDTSEALQALGSQQSMFEWVNGVLKHCAEYGWAFIADEINAATADNTMSLHGLTEEESELVVLETSEVVRPRETFQFVSTMNPEDYAGTNRMNRAFKTRFYPIRIPYMEKEAEMAVVREKSNIDRHADAEAILDQLTSFADRLRSQELGEEQGSTLTTPVSSRELIKICNLIVDPDGSQFMPPREATRMVLKGMASPNDWRAISSAIDTTFE